jgi:hypothetical protein
MPEWIGDTAIRELRRDIRNDTRRTDKDGVQRGFIICRDPQRRELLFEEQHCRGENCSRILNLPCSGELEKAGVFSTHAIAIVPFGDVYFDRGFQIPTPISCVGGTSIGGVRCFDIPETSVRTELYEKLKSGNKGDIVSFPRQRPRVRDRALGRRTVVTFGERVGEFRTGMDWQDIVKEGMREKAIKFSEKVF